MQSLKVTKCLPLKEITYEFSKMITSFSTPTSNVAELQLLNICTDIWCCQSFNFSYSCAYKVIFFTINFKDNTCMLQTFSCVCKLLSYLLLWSVYSKVPLFFLTVFPCPLAKRHKFCNDKANFHYVPQEVLFSKVITMCKKWVFNLRCYKIMFNVKWFCCRCSVFKVIKDSVMYVSVLTEK